MDKGNQGKNAGHDWTPLGSRLPKIVNTPNASASTPTSSARNSGTTGSASLARAVASSTGRPRSETDASSLPVVQDEARTVTGAETEADSKKAVLALLRRRGGSQNVVDWSYRDTYGPDGQFDTELAGVVGLPSDRASLLAMDDALLPLCRPAGATAQDEATVLAEVTRTMAVTAGRTRDGQDNDVAVDVFVDELCRFPVDCVVRALGSWRRNDKWRPALAEILADVRWRAAPRLKARAAVRKAMEEAQ